MPIRLPKSFQRRKPSGSALEEIPNPPEPSFRVFEQPPDNAKSFGGGAALKRLSDARPLSEPHLRDRDSLYRQRPGDNPANRGSGGTQNSASTSGVYGTSSSSARYSSSSTLPSSSSIEAPPDENPHAHPKPLKVSSLPPQTPTSAASPGFLRAAGRTFSFGTKKAERAAETARATQGSTRNDIPRNLQPARGRAPAETGYASEGTAAPPRLLDTALTFDSGDADEFGDLFAGLGKLETRKPGASDNNRSADLPDQPKADGTKYVAYTPPPPLQLNRITRISTGPNSAISHNSRDGLIAASPQEDHDIFFGGASKSPTRRTNHAAPTTLTDPAHPAGPSNSAQGPGTGGDFPLRRETGSPADTDALLTGGPAGYGRRLSPEPKGSSIPPGLSGRAPAQPGPRRAAVTLYDGVDPEGRGSGQQTGQNVSAGSPSVELTRADSLLNDIEFQEIAISADRLQARSVSPPKTRPPVKVMTPAQFELYRQEQARRRNEADADDSDDQGTGSEVEEEDESDRNRQMAKQRQKQEAQLSVYRQQMMKVTGEQPINAPSTSGLRPFADPPSLNLTNRPSSGSLRENAAEQSAGAEEEDEDIPLGILAAHGFPSKERPPNHLNRTGSAPNIQYSSEAYPPPPASVVGGGPTNLPVFARNLPQDPYFGAGLVQSTDRSSFALGGGSSGSVYGGSQAGGGPGMMHPPGGLVGVIVSEERARAARRNHGSAHSAHHGQSASGSMPLPPGMLGPAGPMAPLSPGMLGHGGPMHFPPGMVGAGGPPDQQGPAQMAQHMAMMQNQMQWMQQMMAMQNQAQSQGIPFQMPPSMGAGMGTGMGMGMGMGLPPLLPPPQMPGAMQFQRPSSAGSLAAGPRPGMYDQGRSMSMLNPGGHPSSGARSVMMGNGMAAGYAPSVAPSERSNVGQPSRYRAVSIAPADEMRARTQSIGTMSGNGLSMLGGGKRTVKATVKAVGRKAPVEDDEGEEETGWEAMRMAREEKREAWKSKRRDRSGLESVDWPGEGRL